MCNKYQQNRGVSFIEVLVALAVFSIGVITIVTLIIDAQDNLILQTHKQEALFLSQEGVEAVADIYRNNPNRATAGVYGVQLNTGAWSLIPGNDVVGIYTRTITISDISINKRRVESVVSWDNASRDSGSISLIDFLYDWEGKGGDASGIELSMVDAAYGLPDVFETIYIQNASTTDSTLTSMRVQWEGSPTLYRISIGGSDVYSTATSTGAVSGAVIDITDTVLSRGATTTIDGLYFTASMNNSDIHVTATFSDGTSKHGMIDI